jgi:hypothetical protein
MHEAHSEMEHRNQILPELAATIGSNSRAGDRLDWPNVRQLPPIRCEAPRKIGLQFRIQIRRHKKDRL